MCSKFGQSGLFTLVLPALIAENTIFDLLGILDSGERSLPFGRLVFNIGNISVCLEKEDTSGKVGYILYMNVAFTLYFARLLKNIL